MCETCLALTLAKEQHEIFKKDVWKTIIAKTETIAFNRQFDKELKEALSDD